MARPTRRKASTFIQFKKRIPRDVRERAVGKSLVVPLGDSEARVKIGPSTQAIQFSLQTRDPHVARVRHSIAQTHLDHLWEALRNGPVRLSQKQVVALSGEIYRDLVARFEDDPGQPEGWAFLQHLANAPVGSGLSIAGPKRTVAPRKDRRWTVVESLLTRHAIDVDNESYGRLMQAISIVHAEAAGRLRANAEGDYRPDENATRFPTVDLGSIKGGDARRMSGTSLTDLVEGWWVERKATGVARSTYVNYRGTIRKLVAFLGHDDAQAVTAHDVVRFKDHRLAQGVSPRTVKDGDLAALKSILGWAESNLKLSANVAGGISIKLGKGTKRTRSKEFTDEEARTILSAATNVPRGKEMAKTWLAKRWVPWLLAYTGARVGEIVQLRKEDVKHAKDHWQLSITPEAGTVKDGHFRTVPLHPHLIEMGFHKVVAGLPEGHLFLEPNRRTGDVLGPLQGAKNRVTEFVRRHVSDKAIQPNHAWRHRFITVCREIGVSEELRNMITGHSGSNVAARVYGGPAGLYREICRLPRIEID